MKLNELIKKLEERRTITGNFQGYVVWWKDVKEIFEQLDESEIGHADEAPRYVKNILARLRELPLHDREVWLKAIMSEFEQDFSRAKWREGYEVEKEKRYFVKIKGNIKENMLVYGEFLKRYFFIKSFSLDDVIYSHTRKELEDANFGWVFDCSGIEIEEVEE